MALPMHSLTSAEELFKRRCTNLEDIDAGGFDFVPHGDWSIAAASQPDINPDGASIPSSFPLASVIAELGDIPESKRASCPCTDVNENVTNTSGEITEGHS